MKPYILFNSIALLSCIALRPNGEDDILDPAFVVDFTSKDVNRLNGAVRRAVARSVPYIDILEGGTLPSGLSETVRSTVQEQAVIAENDYVRPEFTAIKNMCGTTGGTAKVGSKEYTYELQGRRDKGPLVCIKQGYAAFRTAYSSAEDSLKKGFVKINSNDVRITLVDRSGLKFVTRSDVNFDEMLTGSVQAIDTALADIGLPDSPINFKTLKRIANTMREDFLVEPWEDDGGTGPVLKLIGSMDLLDALRDEDEVLNNQRYLAAGSYGAGRDAIRRYRWEGPYRGIALGVDTQPLRFNEFDDDGNPDYISPEVAVATTNGFAARPNPDWLAANYETCLMSGKDSFKRLVPEKYMGEAGFKWPAQLVNGELRFKVIIDNDNNAWEDYGRHYWQMERAFEPIRPHAVIAVHYKRSRVNLGLTPVDNYGTGDDASI